MKFGKRLRDLLEDSLPDWRNKFLSYKELKKRLKSLPVADDPAAGGNGLADGSPSGAPVAAPELTSEEEFVTLLNTELEKFNSFFMEKEEEFVIRMQVLRDDLEKMKSECASGDLAHCPDCADKVGSLRKLIVSLHGEMVLLENYSALNYTGLVKILKKHDKRTGLLLRHPFISNVLRQPFLTTEILSKLVKECEQRIQGMFPSYSSAASQVDDRSAEEDAQPRNSTSESPMSALRQLPETATEEDVEVVYRSALRALHSLQEIRGSSKTPHPLLAEAGSLPGVSFQRPRDTESGAGAGVSAGAGGRGAGSTCSSFGDGAPAASAGAEVGAGVGAPVVAAATAAAAAAAGTAPVSDAAAGADAAATGGVPPVGSMVERPAGNAKEDAEIPASALPPTAEVSILPGEVAANDGEVKEPVDDVGGNGCASEAGEERRKKQKTV